MTPAAFVAAVNTNGGHGAGVPAWLFHATSNLESPATAAQEQYLP